MKEKENKPSTQRPGQSPMHTAPKTGNPGQFGKPGQGNDPKHDKGGKKGY